MKDLKMKEYLRPYEIQKVFGIDKATLYRWAKEDSNFPEMIKPSKKITLINKKDFERYLKNRNKFSN
jgi:predicted DNA-binding transcriptional regulator AlpA